MTTTTTSTPGRTTSDPLQPSEVILQQILAQLLEGAPSVVTYASIEAAIDEAGFDPLEVNDLYLQLLQALDTAGVPAVERVELSDTIESVDDAAMAIADETLAMLRDTRQRIGQVGHPLLTAADERRLLEIYHDGKRASTELRSEVSRKQRMALERRVAAGETALDELISHNMRLVASYAYKTAAHTRHLEAEDLMQEGLIGLQRAVELYRLDMGFRLSTYATFWIRQAIGRAVADLDRMVRLPIHLIELLSVLGRTTRKLTATLGRTPSDEELAAAMGRPVERVHQLQLLSRDHLSLDLPVGTEGTTTLGDMLPDMRMMEPETALIARNRHETICQFIADSPKLTASERRVLSLRYGLEDDKKRTLQEVGDIFHVTRERIRQIEVKALTKLRVDAARSHLKVYLED